VENLSAEFVNASLFSRLPHRLRGYSVNTLEAIRSLALPAESVLSRQEAFRRKL
jgi:hypothetical protein